MDADSVATDVSTSNNNENAINDLHVMNANPENISLNDFSRIVSENSTEAAENNVFQNSQYYENLNAVGVQECDSMQVDNTDTTFQVSNSVNPLTKAIDDQTHSSSTANDQSVAFDDDEEDTALKLFYKQQEAQKQKQIKIDRTERKSVSGRWAEVIQSQTGDVKGSIPVENVPSLDDLKSKRNSVSKKWQDAVGAKTSSDSIEGNDTNTSKTTSKATSPLTSTSNANKSPSQEEIKDEVLESSISVISPSDSLQNEISTTNSTGNIDENNDSYSSRIGAVEEDIVRPKRNSLSEKWQESVTRKDAVESSETKQVTRGSVLERWKEAVSSPKEQEGVDGKDNVPVIDEEVLKAKRNSASEKWQGVVNASTKDGIETTKKPLKPPLAKKAVLTDRFKETINIASKPVPVNSSGYKYDQYDASEVATALSFDEEEEVTALDLYYKQQEANRLKLYEKDTNPRKSISGRWAEALNDSKENEKSKYEEQKKYTVRNFQTEHRKGLVKKRISQFEELFMQIVATNEIIEATILASRNRKGKSTQAQAASSTDFTSSERAILPFTCGTTITFIFNADYNAASYEVLEKLLQQNSWKPVPILCGVYGEFQVSPPIDVVAVCMLRDKNDEMESTPTSPTLVDNKEESHLVSIALFIDVRRGSESDSNAYGEKKIVFFCDAVSSSQAPADDQKTAVPFWDILLDILPRKATNSESLSVMESPLPLERDTTSKSSQFTVMIEQSVVSNEDDDVTLRPSLWDNSVLDVQSILVKANELFLMPEAGNAGSPNYSVEDVDLTDDVDNSTPIKSATEVDNLVTPERNDSKAGYIFSLSKASNVPEVRQSSVIFAVKKSRSECLYSSSTNLPSNIGWSEYDEMCQDDDMYLSGDCSIDLDALDITSYSVSYNTLILRSKFHKSHIIIGSLKQTISPSFYTIAHNIVFEWTRAVAKSGWVLKWPMKKQSAGMRTKRFFVLRDRMLSYHKHEPTKSEYDTVSSTPLLSVKLKTGDTVGLGTKTFLSCVELNTLDDKLWFRCKDDVSWIAAIKEGIERYSRPPVFYTKNRVENIWHHENPSLHCIAVDAQITSRGYARATLYGSSYTDVDDILMSDTYNANSTHEETVYTLEFGTSIEKEVHIETLSLTGAENSPCLLCMKILGDYIMIGGTDGFIGVAIVGAPSRYRLGISQPSTLSNRGICEVMCRQYEGHCPGSSILCITSSISLEAFAAGDSFGGLSLWKQRLQRTGTSFMGSLKGRSLGNNQITSLSFTPNNKFIVVGTVARLLLVGLSAHQDSSLRMDGLYELDACPISYRSFYAVAFKKAKIEDNKNDDDDDDDDDAGIAHIGKSGGYDKMVVWKLVSDGQVSPLIRAQNATSRPLSTLYKMEWPINVIDKAGRNMDPIVRYRGSSFFDDAPREISSIKYSTPPVSRSLPPISENEMEITKSSHVHVGIFESDATGSSADNTPNGSGHNKEIIAGDGDLLPPTVSSISESDVIESTTKSVTSSNDADALQSPEAGLSSEPKSGSSWRGSGRKQQGKTRVYVV